MTATKASKHIRQLKVLKPTGSRMPVLFVGHGSPMNGIEDNDFSKRWQQIGTSIRRPSAVLCVSAHWLTKGTHITAMQSPKTIHDFGGFPQELFDVQYPAPGYPELAQQTVDVIRKTEIELNHDWGLDHGTWSVVRHMYPEATIPVLQLSIDFYRPPEYHYDLASELEDLRNRGVLIIGSGNMVHNLGMVAWDKMHEPEYGYNWAIEMNEIFKTHLQSGNFKSLVNYRHLGKAAEYAVPTPDHYYPMLYTLALKKENEKLELFNDKVVMGSVSMTSFQIS